MTRQLNFLERLTESEPRPPIDTLLTPDQIWESDDQTLYQRLMEDDRFDRKSAKTEPRGLGPIFSAFSNGPSVRGGVVAFGVSNTKEIEGCGHLSEDRLHDIEKAGMTFCPQANVRTRRAAVTLPNGNQDFIILFRVLYEHDRLVCLTDGSAYQRIGDMTKSIDDYRKQQLRVDKGERLFETEATPMQYPESFDQIAISAFCNRVRASRGVSTQHRDTDTLEACRLGKHIDDNFIPNNACALLFAKDPRWVFPGAIVHFLKYKGIHELSGKAFNVEKDRIIEGSIGTVIKEAAAMIDANLREFTEWNGHRFETVVEYPRDAWYELLVNACVHRSYIARTAGIFVKIFDDRIVFQSPGGLMPGVTPQNIFEKQIPRNRIIMEALRETGEVRCINEGTKRVRLEMERSGLPPPLFRDQVGEGASLTAVLHNNVASRRTGLSVAARSALRTDLSPESLKLTREEIIIINFIAEGGRATVSDVMRLLDETRWHSTSLKLKRLVEKDILIFSSNKKRDPTGFYYLRSVTSGDELARTEE